MSHLRIVLILGFIYSVAIAVGAHAADDKPALEFRCIGTYGEVVEHFEQYSHFVFISQGHNFRVLDIADPAHPREVFRHYYDSSLSGIAINYPALYLAADGVRIFDLSKPGQPVERGRMHGVPAGTLKVMGNFLLAESWRGHDATYAVYDIKDRFHPVQLLDDWRDVRGVPARCEFIFLTDGKRLVCASDEFDDQSFHVTIFEDRTTTPVTIRRLKTEDPIDVKLDHGTLTIVSETTATSTLANFNKTTTLWVYGRQSGLEIGQGAPARPEKISARFKNNEMHRLGIEFVEQTSGTKQVIRGSYAENSGVEDFKIAGDRGYVLDQNDGLQVVNLVDPTQPKMMGRLKLEDQPGAGRERNNFMLRAVENEFVYVSNTDHYLVFDCTSPTSPTLCARFNGPGGRMSIVNNRAYVAGGGEGLLIYDVADPRRIGLLGRFNTNGQALDLATSGSLVYLFDGALKVIDAANPTTPTLVSRTEIDFDEDDEMRDDSACVKKLGPAVYISEEGFGHDEKVAIKVVDVSDPAKPRVVKQIRFEAPDGDDAPTPIQLERVPNPSGWYLCASATFNVQSGGWINYWNHRMVIFDLTDPLEPKPVYETESIPGPRTPTLFKNTLYTPSYSQGLTIMRPTGIGAK
ncbi:MAG: hypothetical protein ABFD69_07145 [Candidatus Sumerlaeia bacterium]